MSYFYSPSSNWLVSKFSCKFNAQIYILNKKSLYIAVIYLFIILIFVIVGSALICPNLGFE